MGFVSFNALFYARLLHASSVRRRRSWPHGLSPILRWTRERAVAPRPAGALVQRVSVGWPTERTTCSVTIPHGRGLHLSFCRFSGADAVDGLQNEDGGWRGTWPWQCRCRDSRRSCGTRPLARREAGRPNDSLYRISPAHRERDFNDAANGSKCVEHCDKLRSPH